MNANIPSPPTSVSTSAKSLLFKPKLEPLVEDERNVEFRSSFATSTFPHSTLPSITSFSSPSSVTSLPPISPLYLKKRVTNDSLYEDVSESDGDDDDVDGLKVWMENMKIKEASGDHLHEQKRLLPRSDLKLPSNARRVNEWRSIDVNEFPFKPLASASQHNLEDVNMRWAQAYSNEADTFSQSFKQRVSFHDKEPNVFSIPSRHGSFNEESNHLPIQLLQQSPPRPSPLHSSIPHNESIEGLNEKRQSSSNTVLRHIPVAAEPIVPHRSKSFRRFLSTIFGDFGKTMVIDIGESNTKMVAATSSSTSTTDMDTSAAFDSIETLSSGGDVKRRKSIGELFKNWRREQRSKTGASAEIESTDNVATSLGGRIVWK